MYMFYYNSLDKKVSMETLLTDIASLNAFIIA